MTSPEDMMRAYSPDPERIQLSQADKNDEPEPDENITGDQNEGESSDIIGAMSTLASGTEISDQDFCPQDVQSTKSQNETAKNKLIEQYKQILNEHKFAKETNIHLQTRLAEYFRRKKADVVEQLSGVSSAGGSSYDVTVDFEQRYNKYLSTLMESRKQLEELETSYNKQLEDLRIACEKKQSEMDTLYEEYITYKTEIGKSALHSRTGRSIPREELNLLIEAEKKKHQEIMVVRLENIKLKNEVAKINEIIKSKQELAEGLQLIDFEQLKIENQTYTEKIEERNEELVKLKKKIGSTVQVMSHVKEKLQSVQNDNIKQRQLLSVADSELSQTRDKLTKLKHVRDQLRSENKKLRRACGLLSNTSLLFNYEESVDIINKKRHELEESKKIAEKYEERIKAMENKLTGEQK